MPGPFTLPRHRLLNDRPENVGPVVYWMHRDQRVQDNWALIYALECARRKETSLVVVFCLVPQFLGASWRQYAFMLGGMVELSRRLSSLNVDFRLFQGSPPSVLPDLCRQAEAGLLVTDFSPLRLNRQWKEELQGQLEIALVEVDAHNVIPCWLASLKQEYAAHTFRKKVKKALPAYLEEFPGLEPLTGESPGTGDFPDWEDLKSSLEADLSVPTVEWCQPGEQAGLEARDRFIRQGLHEYHLTRNDPVADGQSQLSPYLHFGMISAQRLALQVQSAEAPEPAKQEYLEELIVRRELADNYCYYQPDYDTMAGFPRWARQNLALHADDPRQHLYSLTELEAADTHDPLWNAAQLQMVKTGKMHGYLRMYWAKKILEWTNHPQQAQNYAIYLNDRYQLDGRDPNGYTGVAWSIGGVHDRPWAERPVFGQVRYMNYRGARRKFDVDAYIRKVQANQDP